MLASKMVAKYRYQDCVVVALDDGGVMVGAEIAKQLHCLVTLMLMEEIILPREITAIAGMATDGKFTYNKDLSSGEIDEFVSEYRGYLDEERIRKFQLLNHLRGSEGLIRPAMLQHRNVIIVSDGLYSNMKLDLVAEILKPIEIASLVVAIPLATVNVIDKIHVLADAIFCLSVIDDYIGTDHYYDKNDLPDHQRIIRTLEDIILKWK